MSPVIVLKDVDKRYGKGRVAVHAMRNISLTISRGEFVAIMGASGSGKSTLMNVLGCLDSSFTGEYLLNGVSVSTLDGDALAQLRNRKLGFIFQGFNLLKRDTAVENVELPMLSSGRKVSLRDARARAEHCLAQVGLADRANHLPNELSGGQQQRVAIARALLNKPEVIFADEPTGNLDSRTSIEVMGIFQALNAAGITIVMVTHESDIASYGKRIIVMQDGQIVRDTLLTERLQATVELQRIAREETAARSIA